MQKFHDTRAAAQYLHDHVPGESVKYWSLRLHNLRRSDRPQPFKLEFAKVEGKAGYYTERDLAAYVEFEKTRRLGKLKLSGRAVQAMRAFGIGEAGGGTQGRRFAGASVNLQVSNQDGKAFVQTIINEPLMVFAMTPDQAVDFGKQLIEVGEAAQRINASALSPISDKPDLSAYETVTDNADVIVKRRKAPK